MSYFYTTQILLDASYSQRPVHLPHCPLKIAAPKNMIRKHAAATMLYVLYHSVRWRLIHIDPTQQGQPSSSLLNREPLQHFVRTFPNSLKLATTIPESERRSRPCSPSPADVDIAAAHLLPSPTPSDHPSSPAELDSDAEAYVRDSESSQLEVAETHRDARSLRVGRQSAPQRRLWARIKLVLRLS